MLVVENAFITVMTTGGLRHIESMAAILGQSLEPDYLLFLYLWATYPEKDIILNTKKSSRTDLLFCCRLLSD